jgi:hypothetical protein
MDTQTGVTVDMAAFMRTKSEAATLRDMVAKLSPVEKAIAGAQIKAVTRLVEAVEAL